MGALVLWTLAALGVVVLIVARHEIRRAWGQGNRFQSVAATILVGAGVLSETTVVGSPALMRQVAFVGFAAVIILGSFVARGAPIVPRLGSRLAPVLWAMGLWLWLFLVDAVQVFADAPTTVLIRSLSGVLLLAVLFAQTRLPLSAHHFTAASVVVMSGLLITLPLLPRPIGDCTIFKCSELGFILVGHFSSGNFFGIVLAMTAALVLATVSSFKVRVVVVLVMAAALYATGSRTSLATLGVGVALYGIFEVARYLRNSSARQSLSGPRELRGQRRKTVKGLIVSVGVAILIPLAGTVMVLIAQPDWFSNRGNIWRLGVSAVGDSGLTGIGLDSWALLQRTGQVSYLFAHSEYMLIYFSGGIIGVALFALWLVSVITGARMHLSVGRAIIVPLVFAMLGLLEVVWNPLTVDGLAWHAIAVSVLAMPFVIQRTVQGAPSQATRQPALHT